MPQIARPGGSCGPSTSPQHLREGGSQAGVWCWGLRESPSPDSGCSLSQRRGSGLMKTALVLGFSPGGREGRDVPRTPGRDLLGPSFSSSPSPPSPHPRARPGHLLSSRGSAAGPVTHLPCGWGISQGSLVRGGGDKRGLRPAPAPPRAPPPTRLSPTHLLQGPTALLHTAAAPAPRPGPGPRLERGPGHGRLPARTLACLPAAPKPRAGPPAGFGRGR